jgi:two-component system, OmpR family, phosphate regulon sensor histidine kinase PhoR
MAADRSIDTLTPRQVALVAAAFVGILVGMLAIVLVLRLDVSISVWWCLLLATVAFGAAYLVVMVALERFINARIRLLFRMVHDLKTDKGGSAPVVDMSTDVLGQVQATVEDWAQEKRTEITELREREQFRREFIGNLSHELKTPIFNIQGYILTLLEGGLEDPKVNRDFLERAARGTDRLTKIVEDMDLIAKLESGVMEMTLEPTDLSDLVNDELADASRHAKEKGIILRSEITEPLMVQCDPGRMAQLFMNLLNNAINYGRPGGSVVVRAFTVEGGQVLVEVSDNGIGIAPEHLPRLFERFYRVGKSRARNEGGSGLGLAIVKHIIDAHGQSITVRSTEGEGTVFAFTLKRA